jgi:hypothetical protein
LAVVEAGRVVGVGMVKEAGVGWEGKGKLEAWEVVLVMVGGEEMEGLVALGVGMEVVEVECRLERKSCLHCTLGRYR